MEFKKLCNSVFDCYLGVIPCGTLVKTIVGKWKYCGESSAMLDGNDLAAITDKLKELNDEDS